MSGQANDSTSIPNVAAHSAEQISAETIEKCAGLLAVGEMDWPEGLSGSQRCTELLARVSRQWFNRQFRHYSQCHQRDIRHDRSSRACQVFPRHLFDSRRTAGLGCRID